MTLKCLFRSIKRNILFTVYTSACIIPALSQSLDSDSITNRVHNIPDVTIKARRAPNKVSSTIPVQSMRKDAIDNLGIQSISDAVRRFAGTEVKDYGGMGGIKTVSVRNMGAVHTAIGYDGIAVSNCQAGQIDIGRFSLDNVESITLSIGQNDDLLQSARLFSSVGVLNITTEKPVFTNKDYKIKAQVKSGSFGYINPYIKYSQKLGDKTSMSIDGDFLYFDGNYPFILTNGKYKTEEKRINSDVSSWHTEANLFHSFSDNSNLKVKGYYYQSYRGLPGAIILYNSESNERLWDKNAFVQAQYNKEFSNKWSMQVQGKYNYSWNKYRDEGAEYADGYIIDRYRQNEYYTSVSALYNPLNGLHISAAQDIAVNTLHSNIPDCAFPVRLTSLSVIRARYEISKFKFDVSLLNTFITESVETGNKPDNLKKLSPSFSMSYKPLDSESLFLRAMYKNTFRTPTFNDLYYYRMGNRNLKPEKAEEYNIGITWMKQNICNVINYLSITADAYYNSVKDKIVAFPTTYIWKMQNYGKTSITGLDITAAISITPYEGYTLDLNTGYTFQKAIDVTNPEAKNYRHQLPYTPKHNGNVSASLETPWITLGYSIIAVGKRYYLAQNLPENEVDSYTDHTLSVSREFNLKKCKFRLQGDIVNLTDTQYDVIKYYPMPGRSWRITASINL